MKNILVTVAFGLVLTGVKAQDIHFARTKDMQKWYNASLKSKDDQPSVTLNYRNVTYKQLIAFKSVAALADVPLLSRETQKSGEKKGYFSITGGFAVDKSNQGILRNTTGLLGVSYHLPINTDKSTFISMGVQGALFENRINMDGATTPDQFDKYGLIPNSSPNDPGASGKISFFSLNSGLSVAHSDAAKNWYLGVSARHLNRPETNFEGNTTYRLPVTTGAQAGYEKISGNDAFGIDLMLNFKSNAYEHMAGVHYTHTFDPVDFDGAMGASLAYRYKDAIIPGVHVQVAKTIIGFNYDMIIGNSKTGLNRIAYELGVKQIF